MKAGIFLTIALFLAIGVQAGGKEKPTTIRGYVLDSACAFTKNLNQPVSRACALACAKAGSPLVILAYDGNIYWPISDSTPATGQNSKLLKFAGQKVSASGKIFQRGGSRAIVIESIAPETAKK